MVQQSQQAREREQQLNQQLTETSEQLLSRYIIIQESLLSCSYLQLSVMSIAEGREEQPHWVVRREAVELTEEVLGRGGWGEVKVAKFRGLRV